MYLDALASFANQSPRMAFAALISAVLGIGLWIAFTTTPNATPAFRIGQLATMKLDGGKVMVLNSSCREQCDYYVRTVKPTGYDSFWAREYELASLTQ